MILCVWWWWCLQWVKRRYPLDEHKSFEETLKVLLHDDTDRCQRPQPLY